MAHYFAIAALAVVPALLATVASGAVAGGGTLHLSIGLVAAIGTVGANTLLIVFMIVTGRVLREAMATRPLDARFLAELNEFFGRKEAYPAAVGGAAAIVAAGVLGYAQRAFGAPAALHVLLGLGAVGVELWALRVGWRALRANQELVDRTAAELDRLDRESPPDPAELERRAESALPATRKWLAIAAGAWMPPLYWGVVEHRGDFSRVSWHPWAEISALALVLWALARRRARMADAEEPRSP